MRKKEIVLPEIPQEERAELTGALLRWYDGNRRILPLAGEPYALSGLGIGDHASADAGDGRPALL